MVRDEAQSQSKKNESIANEIIKNPIKTLTDRTFKSPSKDKHDFISKAPYWYVGEDGKPVRKDGLINPESKNATDKEALNTARNDVLYITFAFLEAEQNEDGEQAEVYSKYIEDTLNAWFVDEETRMNSSLEYAQMKPGESSGRMYGIIEGNNLMRFAGVAKMLGEKGVLSSETVLGTKKWFNQYLEWLINSEKGKGESTRLNNHATFYTAQIAVIADYLGRDDLVDSAVEHAKSLIDSQIETDGSMPQELKRKGVEYDYQLFNLYGFSIIAEIGLKHDKNLWGHKSSKGVGLEEAFDYFVTQELPKAGKNPFKFDRTGELYLTFRSAATAYNTKRDVYFDLPRLYYDNDLADSLTNDSFDTWLY